MIHLYKIIFTCGIDLWGQFGDYRSIYGSKVRLNIISDQKVIRDFDIYLIVFEYSPEYINEQHKVKVIYQYSMSRSFAPPITA